MKKFLLIALTVGLTGCTLLPNFGKTTGSTAKNSLFVVNSLAKTLSCIDLDAGTVTEVMPTGLYPNQLLAKGSQGFLVNSGDNEVALLDLAGGKKDGAIALAANSNPYLMALGATNRGVVANLMTNKAALLDLSGKAVLKEVSLPVPGASSVAYASGKYYVGCANTDYSNYPSVNYRMGTVYVLDENTLETIKAIEVGQASNPQFLAVDPEGEVQVVCTGDYTGTGKVVVIDPKTDEIKTSISVGGAPGAVAFLGQKAYLADSTKGVLTYDWKQETVLRSAQNPILVGKSPMGIAADGKKVFVANFGDDTVQAIDPTTEATASQWTVGDGPNALAVTSF